MKRQYKQPEKDGKITYVELKTAEDVASIDDPERTKRFELGKHPVESVQCDLEKDMCIVFSSGGRYGWTLPKLLVREENKEVIVHREARISGPHPRLP
jgi:hypothetical protein